MTPQDNATLMYEHMAVLYQDIKRGKVVLSKQEERLFYDFEHLLFAIKQGSRNAR